MKIAVAITGASGSIYTKVLLDSLVKLQQQVKEIGVVWSDNARTVWQHELGNEDYKNYPFKIWDKNDFMAPIASGSAGYDVLIICPCSMGTAGRIAGGISNDLITRAADVMLKERRKLICVVRETPYNLVHSAQYDNHNRSRRHHMSCNTFFLQPPANTGRNGLYRSAPCTAAGRY